MWWLLVACPTAPAPLPVRPAPVAQLPNQEYAMGLPGDEPSAELSAYIQSNMAEPPPPAGVPPRGTPGPPGR